MVKRRRFDSKATYIDTCRCKIVISLSDTVQFHQSLFCNSRVQVYFLLLILYHYLLKRNKLLKVNYWLSWGAKMPFIINGFGFIVNVIFFFYCELR